MAKPILFETIKRAKYDLLDAANKLKNNYLIKENDGTTTKHIGGLENEAILTVMYIVNHENYLVTSADKTFQQITDAINKGKIVKAIVRYDDYEDTGSDHKNFHGFLAYSNDSVIIFSSLREESASPPILTSALVFSLQHTSTNFYSFEVGKITPSAPS